MPCKLRKSSQPGADFEGRAGDKVQLGVSSDSGGATIIAVIYDGHSLSAPWKFELIAGNKLLTVLLDSPAPRDWTTIQEICNGSTNALMHFPFDPYGPTQTFRVEAY